MGESRQIVCPHDGALNRVPANRLSDAPKCGKCHQSLFAGVPVALDASAFDRQAANSQIPLLVDFWAPWCGPCRTMAPAFEQAARLLEPQFRLVKVNTEQEPSLAARYGIRSIPTLMLFAGGREIARQPGAMTQPEQIVRWARSQSAG
jgi:thioredoxin 2